MKKVLIVSYYFPPVNTIASKRYGTMCKYFEENGYTPYVLTIRQDDAVGARLRLDCEMPIDEEQIIQSGSAMHCAGAQNCGWRMTFGFLEYCKYNSRTVEEDGNGWHEQVKAEKKWEMLKDIDVIIGTFPPMSNLYIALWLARKLKVPFIADIRDLISDYAESPAGYRRAFWIDRMMERNVLRKAAAIVPVTSGFKKILKERYPGKQIKAVYNGWDRERVKAEAGQDIQTDKYLYYAGSFYPHRLESFRLLISCLKKINAERHEKIKFIVRAEGLVHTRVRHIVRQEEMAEYVCVLPAVSEDIVRQEQEKAYINIVLSSIHSGDKALMATVPGKVYELLQERAPVLAIVPAHSDVAKVLKYTNKGIASVKEKDITDFIVKKHENYVGSQKVDFFSRRNQAKRLCKFMDQLLAE